MKKLQQLPSAPLHLALCCTHPFCASVCVLEVLASISPFRVVFVQPRLFLLLPCRAEAGKAGAGAETGRMGRAAPLTSGSGSEGWRIVWGRPAGSPYVHVTRADQQAHTAS